MLLITIAFGLSNGVALFTLTRERDTSLPKSQPFKKKEALTEEHPLSAWLTIRSAHPLKAITLLQDQESIKLEEITNTEYETELTIPESGKLHLTAEWEKGTPETALQVTLEPSGLKQTVETFWAQGLLSRELNFNFSQ